MPADAAADLTQRLAVYVGGFTAEQPAAYWLWQLGAAATILGVTPSATAATHLSSLQEDVMSDPIRPYEPLTSENAALVLFMVDVSKVPTE